VSMIATHDRELPDYSGYFPTVADDIRKERRQRLRKLMRHPQLRELVIEQLKALWSPEQIAGRLLADGVSAVRVCTETICRLARKIRRWSSISICRKAAANAAPVARGNLATAVFLLTAGYRNVLISLVIVRSSATGKATC
jgi:IS30 family transposase